MKCILLFALFFICVSANADEIIKVHVEDRDISGVKGEYIFPFKITGKGYISKTAWRSPSGIKCSISLFEHSKDKGGTYECVSRDGYKAQVSLDCELNHDRDSAVYLFFGQVKKEGESGNFYVWCDSGV